MNEEIWKDIKGYEGLYRVSNTGKVLGVKRNKILKQSLGKVILDKKTYIVGLCKNGTSITVSVHTLVYKTFKGDPAGMIDFKDGNSDNIRLDNLIDVNNTFNFKKAHCKKVLDTVTMKLYDSIYDLERYLGVSYGCAYIGIKKGFKKYSQYQLID